MSRVPASQRTRNELKKMIAGESVADRSSLVRQAARLIVEEALEAEAEDALGRGYYEHGAQGHGYRNGYRRGRIRSAEGEIEFAVPQVSVRKGTMSRDEFMDKLKKEAARGGGRGFGPIKFRR